MTEGQRRDLEAVIDPVWAEELLIDRGATLTPESLRALTLIATGSHRQANLAYGRRVIEELERSRKAKAVKAP